MSTNAVISIKDHDKYRAIYCHWDGYVEHTGNVLASHYNTIEKAEQLISLGDISFLDKHVAPEGGVEHTFEKPLDGVTIAYHRDRGEPLRGPREFMSLSQMIRSFSSCTYIYVCEAGQWQYCTDRNYELRPIPGFDVSHDIDTPIKSTDITL
ncbi:hypothetical protein LJC34_07650 [Oscillospiraceae bacterium OttesenSCG-928-G22]|nr:hypothetical protein [Oscillospiraceae bacterium OttesenSCG-928-G22]